MALWTDEWEAQRDQLREESAQFLASWERGEDDPSKSPEERIRAMRANHAGDDMKSDRGVDRTIDGPAGPLRLRTFTPESGQVDGVMLHFHGGGMVAGTPEMMDLLNVMLADAVNLAVVSVDYRLAPEHPHPAGNDDCEAAAVWLLEHAQAEFGSDRIVIGGESAGAYFSATTLLRMRDRHDAADRFAGANLLFGCYDITRTPSARGIGVPAGCDAITPAQIELFYELYTPGYTDEQRRDPDVSPLYADLTGMPPALFAVGGSDHLVDDTLFMATRWQRAGNRAELVVYPECPHGAIGAPTVAADFFPRLFDFLKTC